MPITDKKNMFLALVAILFIISLGFYVMWMLADNDPDKNISEIFLMIVIGMLFIVSVAECIMNTNSTLPAVPFMFCAYALMSLVALDRNTQYPPEKKKMIQYRTFAIMFGYSTIIPYILFQISCCLSGGKCNTGNAVDAHGTPINPTSLELKEN